MSSDVIAGVVAPVVVVDDDSAAKTAAGLFSPPDSKKRMVFEDSDSELSELDEEGYSIGARPGMGEVKEEREGGGGKDEAGAVGEERKPEEEEAAEEKEPEVDVDDIGEVVPDHYADEGRVPVFKPTMHQFKDFQVYMDRINKYGMQSGIVKVVPPQEWLDNQPAPDEIIKTIRVREPIKQDIMGTNGTYRQMNLLHQRAYNLPEWRQLCDQTEHQPPARRGEVRATQEKTRSSGRVKKESTPAGERVAAQSRKKNGRASRKSLAQKDADKDQKERLPTPTSPPIKPDDDAEAPNLELLEEDEPPRKRMGGGGGGRGGKATTVSSRRKYGRRETAGKIDEAAFENFEYKMDISDYTPERCEELERAYWKTLTYAPPLYGADMLGSLFDERTTTWNLGNLPNLLDVMGTKIPGVNTAYLYLGMWKATFAWHLEDVDLYSINYLHFGAPKHWYSISQRDARKFEAAMKSIWPTDAKECDQFLRHKTFLISPSTLLKNYGIKANKITHFPGEFMITFPYGYHSGFNMGYNCAEAVNFAMPSWLEMGRIAKKCDCAQAQDSVWIDVAQIERKMRGEETDYEETDEEEEEEEDEGPTDLPTPPESSGDAKLKQPRRKRKRVVSDKDGVDRTKRIRIRMKISSEPCCLCPNDIKTQPLIPTEDGRKVHRLCAEYTPETDIDEGIVYNVSAIGKDRLDLKCMFCHSRKGAKIQCSQRKCTRSYHATCAAAAGMFVETGEIPVFGEDGTEYKQQGIEFSCRFHRAKRDKKLDEYALEEDEDISRAAMAVKEGEICQFQFLRKEIFAGVVVENRTSEEVLLVDILPSGDRFEVQYKYILLPDPTDFHLPKPSDKAIPMPRSRHAKDALVTTKRHADDLPRKDDAFVEGATWAEFNSFNTPRNPAQVKVDLSKERQVMYYMGKTSTEAKAQYTADWTKPVYDTRCNFLETIPKPPPAPRASYPASYPRPSGRAINPSRPAPPRPPTTSYKPILPPSYSQPQQVSVKSDKPYVYKPKAEQYYADRQVNNSQLSYTQDPSQQYRQQSQPYPYGTDSRWRPADNRAQSPYVAPAQPRGPVAQNHYNNFSAPNPLQQGNNHTPLAPHSHSHPQAMQAKQTHNESSVQKPTAKSHGHRSSSSSAFKFNDVFQKYPYLQKQHNKAPGTYRSPYRQDMLGFCNGYEGDFRKHMEAQMRKDPRLLSQHMMQASSGQLSSQPKTTTATAETPRKTYPAILPPAREPYSSPAASYYPNGAAAAAATAATSNALKQQQMLQPQITKPTMAGGQWEKKEAGGLHPAIRAEYANGGGVVQGYQGGGSAVGMVRRESPILPPGYQRPQVQPQTPQLQPQQQAESPAAGQWNAHLHQPQQQMTHVATPPPPPPQQQQQSGSVHMSPAAQYYSRPPSRPQSSPLTQLALQPQVNAAAVENVPPPVQNFSQSYSKPVKSFYSDTYHAVGVVGRKGGVAAVATPVAMAHGGPVLSLPPQQVVETKSNSFTGAPVALETKIPDSAAAGAMDGVQMGEIPEMDTDSAGMMETLMRNLQRAARQGQV
ncbi:hypothetical protein VE01_03087 [Pseudogymnoascus verrucosus]|uniref:[histone H3]-trimethyl-L-lysine(9) demethylase n=1 Tax=Pseudogymnoascus verrucosus TaxID=342668 RepID=A0A1B8GRF7_9PEZI|nr:uncharacterized protein VE01_03087 [Pseudogymnoascus verrucosus]OBT98424.1 hypothetical protein VE01_03087 [Pseudogymnoascus verrucosus]